MSLISAQSTSKNMTELIENPEEKRYTVFPIKDDPTWQAYKKAKEAFWVEEEIDSTLAKDREDWETLDPAIKHLVKYILAFFAVSDGVVNETLTEEIVNRINSREIKLWYNYQIMMEDIHNIVYSKLIDTYITVPSEKRKTFDAIEHFPSIRKKIGWVHRWLGKKNDVHKLDAETQESIRKLRDMYQVWTGVASMTLGFRGDPAKHVSKPPDDLQVLFSKLDQPRPTLARQLLINTIMEGLFFSASFCVIFWINHHYHKLPGLVKANEAISRDEGMHTLFGAKLYNRMKHRLPENEVHSIIAEAVEIESDFINEALPKGLLNMNAVMMKEYLQFVADQLLILLKYKPLFGSTNPFKFMEKQSMSVRIPDFFAIADVLEYGHHSAGMKPEDQTLSCNDDF